MANIKNMEMGKAISAYENLEISKSLFGLRQSIIYRRTQSPVDLITRDYAPEEGARLERLLNSPLSKIEQAVKSGEKIASVPVGNIRLEACVSRDRQFVGFQLFRFSDFLYHPLFDARFFEGDEAQLFAALF